MDGGSAWCDNSSLRKVHDAKARIDRVAELTNTYRSYVFSLGESSTTQIAWLTSQHVLDGHWQKTKNASTSATDFNTNSIDYACQECGFILHPGWRGTRLRTSRTHVVTSAIRKTLRRREQRKRKQAARAKQMKGKDNGRRPTSTETTADKNVILLENDPNVNNGLDRNHVILTCGRCHAKYFLKGPRHAVARRDVRPSISAPKGVSSEKRTSSKKNKTIALEETGSLEGDFVSLLPTKNYDKKERMAASSTPTVAVAALSSSPPLTLLEQRQQERFGNKKKKQKKNLTPKNNLLNFLSSFNDP